MQIKMSTGFRFLISNRSKDPINSLQRYARNRSFFLSITFTLLIYAFEEYSLGSPQGWYLLVNNNQYFISRLIGILSTAISFLSLVLFIWISLISYHSIRAFCVILFSSATLCQYGYFNALHRMISPMDIDTAIKSTIVLWSTAIGLFFNWTSLITIFVYVVFLVLSWKTSDSRLGVKISLLLIIFCSLNIGLCFTANVEVNPGISASRLVQTIYQWAITETRYVQREYLPPISNIQPANNIVFIIDESIRSDHLSLNAYPRQTTPYLDQIAKRQSDIVYNWGTAAAGMTCTALANALLITGVQILPENYKQVLDLTNQYPTIFNYAKAMGYQTYYFDAQSTYLYNGLSVGDLKYVDYWINENEMGKDIQVDFRAADRIHKIISNSVGNFILINKKGVHFTYEGSYPPENNIWLPLPLDYLKDSQLVKNSYDNGLLYNVNTFFSRLILDIDVDTQNTVNVYTSDHGQTLFDNGETWLHCNFTKNEASVPLLLIGRLPFATDTFYKASHSNIFPTLLDLMSVPKQARTHSYALSLLEATANNSRDRYFLSGTLDIIPFK